MGLLFKIQLKKTEDTQIAPFNKKLEAVGIKGRFTTHQDNVDWVNHINKKDSPEAHLRPENGKMTVAILKKTFSMWTKEGMFDTDIAFGRTSDAQMKKIVRFVVENADKIEFVDNGDELIERSETKNKTQIAIFKRLEQVDEEPEMLPKDKQVRPDSQSGQLLCKSFSTKPFWVVFGNVEEPKFMKTRIYVDELMNNIYKDKKGLAYMLIPLVTIGHNPKFGKLSREEFYQRMAEMGLREHPSFFFPMVYNNRFANSETWKPKHIKELAKDFAEFYTKEEIEERFETVMREFGDSKAWFDTHTKRYKHYQGGKQEKLDLLTILDYAKYLTPTTKG